MAVLVIGEVSGGDAAMDNRIQEEIGVPSTPAAGAIARFAGPTDGGYQVITVWESEDALQTFWRERLLPAFKRLGISPPTPRVSQLDNYRIAPR